VLTGSGLSQTVAAVLHPTTTLGSGDMDASTIALGEGAGSFVLTLDGSGINSASDVNVTSASLDPSSANYITKIYGYAPKSSKDAYTLLNFSTFQSSSLTDANVTASLQQVDIDYTNSYLEASTPWIKSQKVGGVASNLIKFHTLSHGNSTNYEFKVGIRDIKPASEVPGSEYGTFSVIVRRVDTAKIPNSIFGQGVQDTDVRPNIVEEFQGVNLDPNSPNYIKRVIGDRWITVDANGKLTSNGDYPNASAHIRVEVADDVDAGSIDSTLVPFGFGAVTSPLHSTYNLPLQLITYHNQFQVNTIRRAFLGYSFDLLNN
jgi:hypothetical protein